MATVVHLVAGLNGAGKTTLAKQLAEQLPAVRFSLDEWMLRLHGTPFDDARYPGLAAECHGLIWDTAAQVLNAGVAVVLDWNHWSRERRMDSVQLAAAVGASCELHYLTVPIETAIAQAASRDDPTSHRLTAESIRHGADLFEAPDESEGFTLHLADRSSTSRQARDEAVRALGGRTPRHRAVWPTR